MKKTVLIFLLVLPVFLLAQEVNKKATTNKADEKTIFEKQQELLRYGLEIDIINMLEKTDRLSFDALNADLTQLFNDTKSSKIREKLFILFAREKNKAFEAQSIEILKNYEEYNRTTVKATLNYLKAIKSEAARLSIRKILKDSITDYLESCISTLAKIGSEEDAEFLVDYFESGIEASEQQELAIRQQIMTALAELHKAQTRGFFADIIEDENENKHLRAQAAIGLGKIGMAEDVPVLLALFEDDDPLLRSASIEGLAKHHNTAAEKVLLQAFRDSYYKVRLQAIDSAVTAKNTNAVPFIFYRAKTDPETVVKNAAIDALAFFNTPAGNKWLADTLLDIKANQSLRIVIGKAFIKHNFDVHYDAISQSLLEALGDEKQKQFCYALGGALSKLENPASMPIAQAYLESSDPLTLSIGMDMFYTNKYEGLRARVQEIADDDEKGAIAHRAKRMLEQ